MEFDGFLYETLSPLSTTPPRAPDSSEPYIVLRNHTPIITNSTPLPETSAPEFFSLDNDDDWRTPTPPLKRSRLATDEEPEISLEAGWFRANCRFKSPMIQLHKEILDFCDFLSPTAEEQVSRNTAVKSVSDVIKYIWPNCKVEVFGSFKTGSHIETPQKGLCALSRALSQRGVAKKIQVPFKVIGKACVPIIKFVEVRSGISFDISFDMENGPKAAEYILDAISKLPPLRPLCLILKVFLQQRRLNEVFSGGIGSYALLAMLIAMLQNSLDNHSFPQYNLGVLLVTFFDMYGCKLNTSDVGISCNEESTFFSKRSKGFIHSRKRLLIAIQDPQDPKKDIGKNSYKYLTVSRYSNFEIDIKIKSSFRMACSTLTDTKLIMSLAPNQSILGTIIGPDKVLLERKGGLNGDVTFTNLLPGAGQPLQKDFGEHKGLSGKLCLNDEEIPLPHGKDVAVSDDDVAKESGKKSKKVVKVKKMVKIKKIKKVIVIEERKRTLTDTETVQVLPVTDSSWQSLVLESKLPVLVEFWAPWCGPCRMIHPVVDELAKEYTGKLTCYKVNTDESPSIATKYGIRSIPTIMVFNGGEKKDAIIGAVPKSTLCICIEKFL
ncbi:hypothetical protein L1987_31638 [Smallanthus sonchifolius]|uniref:Uncharacterized protein n=1 Tax=Smallanthus sonchifolius TaxID=185202 RepID=A0ACB9I7N6_9ASTR|nr:hypothetical protein L1987_31638 [Smallanthus sonchifolius]